MSAGYLNERQVEILNSLRDKVDEGTKQLLKRAIGAALPRGDIEAVCQAINNEYLMKGIKEDYTPSEYGRELEDIFDVVNRPRTV